MHFQIRLHILYTYYINFTAVTMKLMYHICIISTSNNTNVTTFKSALIKLAVKLYSKLLVVYQILANLNNQLMKQYQNCKRLDSRSLKNYFINEFQ